MDKRWTVNGIFIMEVEGKDRSEAREKAARILRNSGITGYVIDEKVVSDEQEQKSIQI